MSPALAGGFFITNERATLQSESNSKTTKANHTLLTNPHGTNTLRHKRRRKHQGKYVGLDYIQILKLLDIKMHYKQNENTYKILGGGNAKHVINNFTSLLIISYSSVGKHGEPKR